ncbi:MAG TPA: hypothetical protein VGE07_28705 [Herpetosiphonaceae bacterium]
MDYRTCIDESCYALTYGRRYRVLALKHEPNPLIRVINDRGRANWIPVSCFDDSGAEIPMLREIKIDDDLAESDRSGIEVTISFSDGQRRWCFFMTPAALQACGDQIDGSDVFIHYDAPHRIIVSDISAPIIEAALRQIERNGALFRCTLPLGDPLDLSAEDD